jgi:hypothetical protein
VLLFVVLVLPNFTAGRRPEPLALHWPWHLDLSSPKLLGTSLNCAYLPAEPARRASLWRRYLLRRIDDPSPLQLRWPWQAPSTHSHPKTPGTSLALAGPALTWRPRLGHLTRAHRTETSGTAGLRRRAVKPGRAPAVLSSDRAGSCTGGLRPSCHPSIRAVRSLPRSWTRFSSTPGTLPTHEANVYLDHHRFWICRGQTL